MKRSGFRSRGTRLATRSKKPATRRISPYKGYVVPPWYLKLPWVKRDHGSGNIQKRFWRVISEHVRRRDFERYGKCVSCPHRFSSWQEAQAGHYKPFARCNSWYKYDFAFNLSGQCAGCNLSLHQSSAPTGHTFGEELKRRHGDDVLVRIEADNLSYSGQKMEDWQIVEVVAALRPDLVH